MIGKICPRGQDVAGLIRYLYGPGRREEHTDPHIIAGYRPPADLEPPLRANGSRDFRRLAGLLRLPHDALGKWGYAKPVWHCPMRAAPEDRLLSDAEWAGIAADVMHRTGLCPRGQDDDAVRWIAIRHGPDHIHLVAMLARQDRTRPRIVERPLPGPRRLHRRRAAVRAAVHRPGRPHRGPLPRPAPRPAKPPATGAANRPAPRCAATSPPPPPPRPARRSSSPGWTRPGCWSGSGTAPTNPGQVTGYAVALPGDTARNGEPVWYGGGKLAADLSWPRLAQRWTRPARPDSPLTPDEADALWEYAARVAADATARIRSCTATGTRPLPPTRPAPPRTRCTQPPPRSAAAPCAKPPTGSTAPPASPTGAYPPPPRQGTSSATPPGSSPPTPTSPATAPSPRSCYWSASPPWPKPSPSCASPSSAPPRPPPRSAPPSICVPPPGRPPPGRPAGPLHPLRHPHRNHHSPARPPLPGWPSSASLARPGPAVPHQASPDPARTSRPRYAGHRCRGHGDPPADQHRSRQLLRCPLPQRSSAG